ncbi:MAG: hypothetical protein NWE89_08115 [Candidatus Bathyarchaeota archaeon]|nr:hypothetical protein [Candidatus Bathyarchaeota archaeon]
MDTKQTMIVAILLIGALPALSIYAWQTTPIYTVQNAIEAALQFVENSPTYSWDGVEGSIEVVEAYKTRNPNAVWEVVVAFTSANAGYGDRSDQIVATVITDHVIEVTVEGDSVTAAIIDEVWDEQGEAEARIDDTPHGEAEKMAIEFLKNGPTFSFDGIPGSIEVKDVIAAESYPVQYFITIAFECRHAGYGEREGQMLAQVITPHVIKIALSDDVIGSAIIDNQWDELIQRTVTVVFVISPDHAKDLAVQHVKNEYHELAEAPYPDEWTVSNLTPEGLVGATTLEFTGEGWRVEVHYAVVLEPIYNIKIEYDNDTGFLWEGQIDSEGNLIEP